MTALTFNHFDWDGFDAALLSALNSAAAGDYRAAALYEVYAESDGVITEPLLGLNTDGEYADSPPDWEILVDDWAPSSWIEALTSEACSGTVAHWHATFARYQNTLAQVCRQAGVRLGIPVYYIDHARYDEMLHHCLTQAQMDELFPEIGAAETERARLAGMPVSQQLDYYVSRLGRFDGLIDSEEATNALRALGSAAIPVLLPLLNQPDKAWQVAKLLGEIGIADDVAIQALSAAIGGAVPDSPDQLWACRALARLGHLDMVLAKASTLSHKAIATAVAACYLSSRHSDVSPFVLDYGPLEEFLTAYQEMVPVVAEELAPGRGYRTITDNEVPEAMRGVASDQVIVRRHAVWVLGNRSLGDAAIVPLLREVTQSDPDDDVRRLADISLRSWKADR